MFVIYYFILLHVFSTVLSKGVLFTNQESSFFKTPYCGTESFFKDTFYYNITTTKDGWLKKYECEDFCSKCNKLYKEVPINQFLGTRANILREFSTDYAEAVLSMNVNVQGQQTATIMFLDHNSCVNRDFKHIDEVLYDWDYPSPMIFDRCIYLEEEDFYVKCRCGGDTDNEVICEHYSSSDCTTDNIGSNTDTCDMYPFKKTFCGPLDLDQHLIHKLEGNSDFEKKKDRGGIRVTESTTYYWEPQKSVILAMDDNKIQFDPEDETYDFACEERIIEDDQVILKWGCGGLQCENCEDILNLGVNYESDSVDLYGHFPFRYLRRQGEGEESIAPIQKGDVIRVFYKEVDTKEIGDVQYFRQVYDLLNQGFCSWGNVKYVCYLDNVLYVDVFEEEDCSGESKRITYSTYMNDIIDVQYFCGPLYNVKEFISLV